MGGSDNDDVGLSVAADLTSGVVVAGYFRSSSMTVGSTTLSNAESGNDDAFVAR
jgi:hypothetical protein